MLPDMEKNTSSRKWIWLKKKKKENGYGWIQEVNLCQFSFSNEDCS